MLPVVIHSFIHSQSLRPALYSSPVPHKAVQRGWHLLRLRTHMLPHGGRPAVLVLLLLACLLACCARGARTGRSGIFVGYSEERVPKDWQGRAPQCTDSNGKQVCEAYKKANLCSTGLRPRMLQLDEPVWHRTASVHALCCAYLAGIDCRLRPRVVSEDVRGLPLACARHRAAAAAEAGRQSAAGIENLRNAGPPSLTRLR